MEQALELYTRVAQEADPELSARLELLEKHKKLLEHDMEIIEFRKVQNRAQQTDVDYAKLFMATIPNERIAQLDELEKPMRRRRPPATSEPLADLY